MVASKENWSSTGKLIYCPHCNAKVRPNKNLQGSIVINCPKCREKFEWFIKKSLGMKKNIIKPELVMILIVASLVIYNVYDYFTKLEKVDFCECLNFPPYYREHKNQCDEVLNELIGGGNWRDRKNLTAWQKEELENHIWFCKQ